MSAEIKKEAFEKLRSNVEKRHLFEALIKEGAGITCKFEEEKVYAFQPRLVDKESVTCFCEEELPKLPPNAKMTGFFSVESDRYFLHGPVDVGQGTVRISLNVGVFKLQRRKTMRVDVPAHYPIQFALTTVDGRAALLTTQVVDLSAGGIRIHFLGLHEIMLKNGSEVKGSVQVPQGKIIPFEGVVRHTQDVMIGGVNKKHFGIEMTNVGHSFQRMLVLSMEVQRQAVMGY